MRWFLKSTMIASAIILASCSNDDPKITVDYFLPAHSVLGVDSIFVGDTATFEITYQRPSECHVFNGFDVGQNQNERYITVKSMVFNPQDCPQSQPQLVEIPYDFIPEAAGTFHLKFWKGNTGNNPGYITKTIVAQDSN